MKRCACGNCSGQVAVPRRLRPFLATTRVATVRQTTLTMDYTMQAFWWDAATPPAEVRLPMQVELRPRTRLARP